MAFNPQGFRTIDFIGSVDGSAGSNRKIHAYITNDDTSALQTAGYFNSIAGRVLKGDIIFASLDLDGTPMLRNYVISSNTGGVVAIAAQNVA